MKSPSHLVRKCEWVKERDYHEERVVRRAVKNSPNVSYKVDTLLDKLC